MATAKKVEILDYTYNALLASEAYLEKAKHLTKVEADRLFSRMRGNLAHKLNTLESLAMQLQLDDEQLSEWRKNMFAIREKEDQKANNKISF
ncbi:MAG: hypothetical protein NTU92_02175 [Methylotenera sp.]|nr:hypothetical protein [Methylotenera sp.]